MTWKLNNEILADLDMRIVSGSFRAATVSSLRLEHDVNFDDSPKYAYGDTVAIKYNDGGSDVTFFTGKVISVPKYGAASGEGQSYEIADVWEELDRTIYQEEWGYTEATESTDPHVHEKIYVPRAVFGLDDTDSPIRVDEVITAVVNYAATQGIAIQAGSYPQGEYPLQAEISNSSCAEVIRMALRLHPDWIPWIDHSTTPVTLKVTPVSSMTPYDVPVDGSGEVEFDIVERLDLLPDSVRVCYEYAIEAEDPTIEGPQVFRKMSIDKHPSNGPDAGPGVLNTLIPLQGLTEQRQKSRLWTRTIPDDPSHPAAKDWFKAKYPHLANVPDNELTIVGFDREMIMEWMGDPDDPNDDKDPPAPINPRARRLTLTDQPEDYPRELYKGSVEDWMRVRVGRMHIKNVKITAAARASAETKKAIAKGFPAFTVISTNATNRVYSGPSQWQGTDDVPEDIAQSVYSAIVAANRYQGSCSITNDELPGVIYLARKLRLTGSANPAWSTMAAPITGHSFDVEAGQIALEFGPSPYLSPNDFLELQRTLRAMPLSWWMPQERDKERAQYGSTDGPSGDGDSVDGFDNPETHFEPWAEKCGAFWGRTTEDDGTYLQGGTVTGGNQSVTIDPEQIMDLNGPVQADGVHMYLQVDGTGYAPDGILKAGFDLTAAVIGFAADVPDNTLPTATSLGGICYVSLGVFTETGFQPAAIGNVHVSYCPGSFTVKREGENA